MKTVLSRLVLSLSILALPAEPLLADTITGQVVDGNGVGVPGVTVDVPSAGVSATTDAAGFFTLTVLAGTYDLEILPGVTTLAPLEIQNVTVNVSLNLGLITLQQGAPLSGTVTMPGGLPLVGADISVFDQATGQKYFTPDDNTDLSGAFQVVVPLGTHRVRVSPPVGMLLVAVEVPNVVVASPTVLPTVSLVTGVSLSGTVVNSQTLAPIPGIDIDVNDSVTGQRIVTPGDDTDGLGVFSVVVPTGTYDVTFEPQGGALFVARRVLSVSVPAATNMGTVTMEPGHLVSGTVLDQSANPVVGADLDVETTLGNVRIVTPDDTTDANGAFSLVVPSGSFTIAVEPPAVLGLVGARTAPFSVGPSLTLPTITLQPGVVLSGTILGWNGVGEAGAFIDVFDPATGDELVTPDDVTDASGSYSILVPTGTWDVRVRPVRLSLSQEQTFSGVGVAGPTAFNPMLPLAPVSVLVAPETLPPVSQGGFTAATFAFYNPFPTSRAVNVSLVFINPAGGETPLFPPIPLNVPGQQLFILPGLPVGIPPINPAHAGFPFELELRFTDPSSGSLLDRSSTKFVVL